MHSLQRLTHFPGDTASDEDVLAVDAGTVLFLLSLCRKNGRSGGASREECFPTWITWAHMLNCSTEKPVPCLSLRSFMISSTSLIFLTHVDLDLGAEAAASVGVAHF